MSGSIHPTAIVDPSAEVEPGVSVGAFCVVGADCRLEAGVELHHHVSVYEKTVIGAETTVYPGAVLGAPPQDRKFLGEDSWLIIGKRNTIRENVTMNRGTLRGGGVTRIGDDCLIMAHVHIAHDCCLGDRITMANATLLGGHVVVEDDVGFGGMCALHHFVTVGRSAFVGGTARVNKDVPPFMISEGFPARVRAVNRVGLLRKGYGEETVAWLKEAQRLIFFESGSREEAYERLAAQREIPGVGRILFDHLRRQDSGRQGRALQP